MAATDALESQAGALGEAFGPGPLQTASNGQREKVLRDRRNRRSEGRPAGIDQLLRRAEDAVDSAPQDAYEAATRALKLLDPQGGATTADEPTAAHRARAAGLGGKAAFRLGLVEEALQLLAQAIELARQVGDWRLEAACLRSQCASLRTFGDIEGAQTSMVELLALAHANDDASSERSALMNTATLHSDLGEYDKALEIYRGLASKPALDPSADALLFNNMAWIDYKHSRHAEAMVGFTRSLDLICEHRIAHLEPRVLGNWGLSRAASGDVVSGLAALHSALSLARAIPSALDELQTLQKLGEALVTASAPEEAIAPLERSRRLASDAGFRHDEHDALVRLVGAYGASGRTLQQLDACIALLELERRLYRDRSEQRARALMMRIGLLQSRHEAALNALRTKQLENTNDKLAKANESLRVAIRALGIDVDQRPQRSGASDERLTARESTVLKLIAKGLSNADIGRSLSLSTLTVRHHVSAILRKLCVGSRTQAIAIALRDGLL